MKQKEYIKVTGIIFTVVAAAHIIRLLTGFDVEVGDYELPYWVSILGAAVAGFLAYSSFKLKK